MLTVNRSVPARFFRTFFARFGETMWDGYFDKLVLAATLIYIVAHGFVTEKWEIVAPVAWGLCVVVVIHGFGAAWEVSKEIKKEVEEARPKGFASNESVAVYPFLFRIKLYAIACLLLAICGYCSYQVWERSRHHEERNSFSLAEVAWDHPTVNLGKFPCAPTPTQRVLPDGTCQIIIPPGVLGTALHAEVKMMNTGKSRAEDIYWHGGTVVSDDLDEAGEDALFGRLTAQEIATWPEFKIGETRTLTIRNENPELWNANKVRYLMLRGAFHDDSGKRPDIEFCKRYGGRGKSLFEADHLDEYCKGHNTGINLPKPQ